MTNKLWIDVSRNYPCSRCGKGDWCARSADGLFEICRRENDGTAKLKADKNGSEYYVYNVKSPTNKNHYIRSYRKAPKIDVENALLEKLSPNDLNDVLPEPSRSTHSERCTPPTAC